jgi:hypothetical protein
VSPFANVLARSLVRVLWNAARGYQQQQQPPTTTTTTANNNNNNNKNNVSNFQGKEQL